MLTWYDHALVELISVLESQGYVEGFDFLQDFFLDHNNDYESEMTYASSEDFAEENFDKFQGWIISQGKRIAASDTGRWCFHREVEDTGSVAPTNEILNESPKLSESDLELLNLPQYELNSGSYSGLRSLVSKMAAMKDSRIVTCALNLAKAAEYSGKNDSELVDLWASAAVYAEEYDDKERVVACLKNAAYHNVKISRFEDAAQQYQKAVDFAAAADDKRLLLRNARIQFQNVGDHDAASSVFINEMNIRLRTGSWFEKIAYWTYCLTSNYGESPKKVLANILIWLPIFTVLSFLLVVPGERDFWDGLWDGFYFTIVTFTTLGYGDITPKLWYGKLISGVIATFGLLYTSLFMVTIVRKYSRS
ncbi:potassium channel family protein [Halioxenophilus sp. WMMB6]|uniref:potassium channel family protein n=1 Tax=Halioxenophilus sp. WMMB6 TaxID=3073815 RepID=UPI00295E969B|nr:potassium channel family protein [Halioxenophilus sp. WMMB6]